MWNEFEKHLPPSSQSTQIKRFPIPNTPQTNLVRREAFNRRRPVSPTVGRESERQGRRKLPCLSEERFPLPRPTHTVIDPDHQRGKGQGMGLENDTPSKTKICAKKDTSCGMSLKSIYRRARKARRSKDSPSQTLPRQTWSGERLSIAAARYRQPWVESLRGRAGGSCPASQKKGFPFPAQPTPSSDKIFSGVRGRGWGRTNGNQKITCYQTNQSLLTDKRNPKTKDGAGKRHPPDSPGIEPKKRPWAKLAAKRNSYNEQRSL